MWINLDTPVPDHKMFLSRNIANALIRKRPQQLGSRRLRRFRNFSGFSAVVTCKSDSHTLQPRVIRGSGMGLVHSGEVSDAGFWIAAERWLLNTSVRRWCASTYWRRFGDDIFATTNNFPRFKLVFRWLHSRAAREGFMLKAEGVSQSKVTFPSVDV